MKTRSLLVPAKKNSSPPNQWDEENTSTSETAPGPSCRWMEKHFRSNSLRLICVLSNVPLMVLCLFRCLGTCLKLLRVYSIGSAKVKSKAKPIKSIYGPAIAVSMAGTALFYGDGGHIEDEIRIRRNRRRRSLGPIG